MTSAQKLRDAFADVMGKGWRLVHGIDTTASERYAVYTEDRRGNAFADDAPTEEVTHMMLFVVAPAGENLSEKRRALRIAIFEAGFTWPTEDDDSDATQQMWSYSFSTREAL